MCLSDILNAMYLDNPVHLKVIIEKYIKEFIEFLRDSAKSLKTKGKLFN